MCCGAAVWALSRLMPDPEFAALANAALQAESDDEVRNEWLTALPGAALEARA